MAIMELTDNNFEGIIKKHNIVFVDFWAEWCVPCKSFGQTYAEVAANYPDIVFGKVDIDQQSELSAAFNVRSIPMLIVLKNEIAIFMESGAMPASALVDLVEQAQLVDVSDLKQDLEDSQ